MTIWRRNKITSPASSQFQDFDPFGGDPFDLHDEFGFGDPVVKPKKRAKKDVTPFNISKMGPPSTSTLTFVPRRIAVASMVVVALSACVFLLAKYRPWTAWGVQEMVYAYFEVRAVDQSGRPVAGAVVKNSGKKVGVTDSFGEWRRYMRVPLGATIPLTLAKKTPTELLSATKNFAVPPSKPEKSDLELRASVQLQGAELPSSQTHSTSSTLAHTEVDVKMNLKNQQKTETTSTAAKETGSDHPTEAALADSTLQAIETKDASTTVTDPKPESSKVMQSFTSSHESIWFESTGSQASILNREVFPALVQRAKELGLKVDAKADWKVRLTGLLDRPHVLSKDGGGLIMVTSFESKQKSPREFLRNYQTDPQLTARGILYILSHQVNKNVAIIRRGDRWIAGLPATSSPLWKIAGGMSLADARGQEWLTGQEYIENQEMKGRVLQTNSSQEGPCPSGTDICEFSTRSYAELPPVPSWTRLKLKVSTTPKEVLKVFVSGYEAKATGDATYEYWGLNHAKVNVTLVHAGKVRRLQIQNDARAAPVVGLGVASISKR